MKIPHDIILPDLPGCYLYKNSAGHIIYVGKAKSLKRRVASYFQAKIHDPKTHELVSHIHDLDFIVTDNELEALLLEAKLIRDHRPKYNIDLKDSVRYAYLKLTNEEFPRLLTTRQVEKDNAKYFGPYTDGTSRETSAKIARQLFKIRTCGERLPKVACLQYYIKKCDAPCIKNISQEDYAENIKRATMFLKGKTGNLLITLGQEMKEFSQKQQYERAKERRDQMTALEKMKQTQKVMLIKTYNEHLINYVHLGDQTILQVFSAEKGSISGKQEFRFTKDENILESFIKQYYLTNEIPDQVIIGENLPEKNLIEQYLTKLRGKTVQIVTAQKGNKLKLLEMIKTNILMSIRQESPALIELKEKIYLSGIPNIIECFDISNIQDKWVVGSMVRFSGGLPDKNNYRKFRIRTVEGQDDFASIAEVVQRRYKRLTEEKAQLPDLIVIDGGRGQLSAAHEELEKLNVQTPIISLAKRFEEIYTLNTDAPLRLSRKSDALKLLQRIRDEAHRFAVSYHRQVRSKDELATTAQI